MDDEDVAVRLITDDTNIDATAYKTVGHFLRRGPVKSLRGLHAKVYIVDDYAIVASANLTGAAFFKRFEAGVILPSPAAKDVVELFCHWRDDLARWLKAMCISRSLGTPRNLKFYFRDDDVGLVKDFRKLDHLLPHKKWALAFVYPKPLESDWQDAASAMPANVRHWRCVTKLEEFPDYLFIALWRS